MRYLLDTSIASDIINDPAGRPARRLRVLGRSAAVSVVASGEIRFGALRKGSAELTSRVEEFLRAIDVLSLEPPVDAVYASVRADLEARGRVIGANDTLIAAHALALDRILVTNNEHEFSRVDGLVIENWLR